MDMELIPITTVDVDSFHFFKVAVIFSDKVDGIISKPLRPSSPDELTSF